MIAINIQETGGPKVIKPQDIKRNSSQSASKEN